MPKQSLGQNFLMHPQTAERIVGAAHVPTEVTILEIGPGTGMLTRALLKEGHTVIAVEADGELVQKLSETFAGQIESGQLRLIHEDIREFDTSLLPERYALVANIPYYITGEIIRMFLSGSHKPESMTLLVQREVAVRITGRGEKKPKESLLSLSVKAYGSPQYCFLVPKGAFFPAPKVDSAVISIQNIKKDSFTDSENEALFFKVLRAGFAHKRKLLINNLFLSFQPEKVNKSFEAAGIPPKARSEDLVLADWHLIVKNLAC